MVQIMESYPRSPGQRPAQMSNQEIPQSPQTAEDGSGLPGSPGRLGYEFDKNGPRSYLTVYIPENPPEPIQAAHFTPGKVILHNLLNPQKSDIYLGRLFVPRELKGGFKSDLLWIKINDGAPKNPNFPKQVNVYASGEVMVEAKHDFWQDISGSVINGVILTIEGDTVEPFEIKGPIAEIVQDLEIALAQKRAGR